MTNKNIALIAFQDQPNLGIGYMVSLLEQDGFNVEIIDFRLEPAKILDRVRELDPLLIGFSIIFQYYTPEYAELAAFLRQNGISCLICAGGHYPSLEFKQALLAIQDLDCVVRFEGELTLRELARRLAEGKDWRDLPGLAYPSGGEIITTPLRPLIANLDDLPFPKRWSFSYSCLGIQATSILASRGCPRACTFCSIRRFYSIPPGPVRRLRSPENVIAEMLMLFREHQVRVFLFQDDDFALMSKRDREWSWRFLDLLRETEMAGSILWKISCRTDEVEPEIFAALHEAGCSLVYLGIESGNPVGLLTLNKHISVQQNLQAVEILKSLGISYDFGFMLFDPSSTIELVLENVRFLRQVCDDGSATASFGKTLPYAGTDLEQQMRREGRLRGDIRYPDYSFLDPRTEDWFNYLCDIFYPWVFGGQSLQAQLRWALFECDVLNKFYAGIPGIKEFQANVRFLTHWYNHIFCSIVEDSAAAFGPACQSSNIQRSIHVAADQQQEWLVNELARQRRDFFTKSTIPLEFVVGKAAEIPA